MKIALLLFFISSFLDAEQRLIEFLKTKREKHYFDIEYREQNYTKPYNIRDVKKVHTEHSINRVISDMIKSGKKVENKINNFLQKIIPDSVEVRTRIKKEGLRTNFVYEFDD
jgi:hypothetical protein